MSQNSIVLAKKDVRYDEPRRKTPNPRTGQTGIEMIRSGNVTSTPVLVLVGEPPQDPSSDVWTTYKDFLKRKRDYKREWRKRKGDPPLAARKRVRKDNQQHETSQGSETLQVPVNHRPVTTTLHIPRKHKVVHIEQKGRTIVAAATTTPTDLEILIHEEERHEDAEISREDLHNVSLDTNNLSAMETLVDELEADEQFSGTISEGDHDESDIIHEQESTVTTREVEEEEVVGDGEDSVFLDRLNVVTTRLLSVGDTSKRLRYLKIIEAIVEEAW